MDNTSIYIQDDWSGGENTLLQPELLQPNEATKIVNLLPRRDSSGLALRKGFERIYNSLGSKVYDVFVKRMKSGTPYLFAVVLDGTSIVLKRFGVLEPVGLTSSPSGTTVHTFVATDASWFRGVDFCDWENDKFMFSDGVNPVMVYDHATGACTQIIDQWSSLEEIPKMYGAYLTQVKGRLAMAEKDTSTIHISGSDDSRIGDDGLPIPRYMSWSGTSSSAGGSIDVTPYGNSIVGLAPNYGGLVVFKEDGIYLWQWSDSDAPWDANTSSVERMSMGVTLVDHNTIAQYGSSLYFLAKNERGNLGVFKFDQSEETEVSMNIPATLKRLVDSGTLDVKMYATIVDGYYIVLARSGGDSSIVAFFDIKTGAWTSIDAPISACLHKPSGESFVLVGGSGGTLLKYPGRKWVDDVSTAIGWEVRGARLMLGDEFAEKYWRINWVDASAPVPTTLNMQLLLDNGSTLTCSTATVAPTATHVWDEADLEWDAVGVVWEEPEYLSKYYLETGDRSYGATYRVWGSSSDWFRLNRVGIGYRQRRVRSADA